MEERKPVIFLVDDEPGVREALADSLRDFGYEVATFAGPLECLAALARRACSLLITDVNLPDLSGIDLITRVKSVRPRLPILVISGFADIPMAVQAVKAGADEFFEKPLEEEPFLAAVRATLRAARAEDDLAGVVLTQVERTVLQLVAAGKSNKEIAARLHRSQRTIENHRHRLMRKLKVSSTAALVRTALQLGLVDAGPFS